MNSDDVFRLYQSGSAVPISVQSVVTLEGVAEKAMIAMIQRGWNGEKESCAKEAVKYAEALIKELRL